MTEAASHSDSDSERPKFVAGQVWRWQNGGCVRIYDYRGKDYATIEEVGCRGLGVLRIADFDDATLLYDPRDVRTVVAEGVVTEQRNEHTSERWPMVGSTDMDGVVRGFLGRSIRVEVVERGEGE